MACFYLYKSRKGILCVTFYVLLLIMERKKGAFPMKNTIAKNIKARRIACGMTQEELAAKVFTTRQTISNYETGKSKPDYETIGKIAAALGISGEMLLYDTEDREKKEKLGLGLIITVFVYYLARSLRYSSIITIQLGTPAFLAYEQGYTMAIIPAICILLGWILIRFYELYNRKDKIYIRRPKMILTIMCVIFAAWFIAAIADMATVYEAASDTAKNQHSGPAMLSVYLESFYSKYICKPLALLPALNGIFLFAGGLLAICANGEKSE